MHKTSFQSIFNPMASTAISVFLLLLLFFFDMQEAIADNNHSKIQLGSWLSPKGRNTSWRSSSGRFAFGFYPHGGETNNNSFAVGIWLVSSPSSPYDNTTSTTVVWTAKRDNPPFSSNSILNFTSQGLLLQNGGDNGGQDLKISDLDSDEVVAWGCMNDNGNFVLYNDTTTGNFVVWQSFDYPTDTMLGGQNLTSYYDLVSSKSISDHSRGRFYLSMQDGNPVAYLMNSDENSWDGYWAIGRGASSLLSLRVQGSLCLDDADYSNLPCSNATKKSNNNTTSSIYRATLEPNGNFILYQHQFEEGNTSTSTSTHVKILWQALNDTCQIKGYCGSNSYCYNSNADCKCFPGFTKTATGDCVQIHSNDNCESSEDPTMLYNITHFQNMTWDNFQYSTVYPVKNQEACEKACRQDCYCGGALYNQTYRICYKYKLPIIYARFDHSSSIALIKIPSGAPPITPPPPTSNNTNLAKPIILPDNKTHLIIILSSTLGSISLIFLVSAVFVFITYRRQLRLYTTLSQIDQNLGFTQEYSLRAFSYDELVKSTEDFAEEIGRGSFGVVYAGTILVGESNKRIAVKRLERINNVDDEGEREFRAEVTAIARTHHRNLVKLIGFCIDGSKKLLVYDYLSNGSLASLLFEGGLRLGSKEKMKMALDVARGLLYLHEECEVRIIHCNIKPQNILMDEAWNAKITDFGLARLLKRECSRMKIREEDKSGYLAPEWHNDSTVSVKADIYSFGIVLLEIVCRKSNVYINVSSAGETLLSNWAYQCFASGQLNKLNDHEEDVDWKIVERMVKVGLWCVQDYPNLRPSIKNVILMLEGLKDIPDPPSPARLVEP